MDGGDGTYACVCGREEEGEGEQGEQGREEGVNATSSPLFSPPPPRPTFTASADHLACIAPPKPCASNECSSKENAGLLGVTEINRVAWVIRDVSIGMIRVTRTTVF